jgi:hypothetical protein
MNLFRSLILFHLLLLTALPAVAQDDPCEQLPFIRGLRVYGGSDERNLPVFASIDTTQQEKSSLLPHFLTIRFDVNETMPPLLRIRFRHCDKDWNVDTDYFVRDDFYTFTRTLFYEAAPTGPRGFQWRYENRFPSEEHPFVRFLYSGNWMFEITDERDESQIYADGRFIVVEPLVRCGLQVFNDYWTEYDMPRDQVHRLRLTIDVPDELFPDFVRTADLYKNAELFDARRVDSYDFKPNTFVEGLGMRNKVLTYRNMEAGNSYRHFDFLRPAMYPSGSVIARFGGADFTRYRFSTDNAMHYGTAVTPSLRSWDVEYLCVLFELEHPFIEGRDIFVAGIFNNWDPQPADRMRYDENSGYYLLYRRLLRGSYDYQYVVGNYDAEAGYVRNGDWIALEGNSWAAQHQYWAIVYYDDDTFGGVTRAVGFARAYSGR